MKYLKKFNESSNEDLCQKISIGDYLKWMDNHTKIEDYDEVFDLFDDKFNLYEDEPGENYYNTFKIKKNLKIRLNKLKQEIFIDVFDDEWFGISQFFFENFMDDDYTYHNCFICDTIDGVKEFLSRF